MNCLPKTIARVLVAFLSRLFAFLPLGLLSTDDVTELCFRITRRTDVIVLLTPFVKLFLLALFTIISLHPEVLRWYLFASQPFRDLSFNVEQLMISSFAVVVAVAWLDTCSSILFDIIVSSIVCLFRLELLLVVNETDVTSSQFTRGRVRCSAYIELGDGT